MYRIILFAEPRVLQDLLIREAGPQGHSNPAEEGLEEPPSEEDTDSHLALPQEARARSPLVEEL